MKMLCPWFKQALELLLTETETETDQNLLGRTLVNQMEAHCWEIDYPGMTVLAEQHLPKIEAAGDAQHISRIFTWLGDAYINTGRFVDALTVTKNALQLGETIDDLECSWLCNEHALVAALAHG